MAERCAVPVMFGLLVLLTAMAAGVDGVTLWLGNYSKDCHAVSEERNEEIAINDNTAEIQKSNKSGYNVNFNPSFTTLKCVKEIRVNCPSLADGKNHYVKFRWIGCDDQTATSEDPQNGGNPTSAPRQLASLTTGNSDRGEDVSALSTGNILSIIFGILFILVIIIIISVLYCWRKKILEFINNIWSHMICRGRTSPPDEERGHEEQTPLSNNGEHRPNKTQIQSDTEEIGV
ncbi:uncharacterized protein [Dendropsophus ebraccatus]|uniref:uncharacterized protein isoform X2 n=1 Tax=Dendropsophus ebraccatus TaxID=150705 RepID=UPI00383216F6